jgi:hypothetical protein
MKFFAFNMWLFIFTTGFATVAFGQNQNDFTFSQAPTNYQLYPRNSSNQALVVFSGNINWTVPYQYVKLRVYSRVFPANYPGSPIATVSATPAYVNSTTRSFSVSYTITGSLTDYFFQFGYTYNATDTYFKSAQDVVAGDVYIVTGQSNSIAQGLNATDDDQYVHHYSRAYGMYYDDAVQYCNYTGLPDEAIVGGWGPADAYSNTYFSNPQQDIYSNHFAGLTGLKFALSIIQQSNIPVAIIHGGAGGQEIANFLPAATVPSNYTGQTTYNLYNFLEQKTINANVQGNIKAIVWYQGEADALDDIKICDYDNKFQTLYNSWKTDFSSMQRIYMMQINTLLPSNGSTSLYPNYNDMHVSKLRNMQRLIANLYSDVSLIPTVGNAAGDRASDEIHYSVAGYVRNGALLYKIISKQLYTGSPYSDNQAYAPALIGITSSGNVINLEYNRNIGFQGSYLHPNGTTYYLKNHFFDQNDQTVSIASVSANGKILSLTLSANTPMPTKLTYLPSHEYYNGSSGGANLLYAGPWITSTDGLLGVASFYQVAVDPDFTAGNPTCSGTSLVVNVSSPVVAGLSHLYQLWNYDVNTGHFTGSPITSLSSNAGTLVLPAPGTYAITHGTWGACQPWQFTEMIYKADNLARFVSGAAACNGNQTQISCTASSSTPSSSWKSFTADAAGNITNSNPVQTFANLNACTFTNLSPGQYYVIEHKSWGGCATSTHTFTQHLLIPSTVVMNSGVSNFSAVVNTIAPTYITVSASSAVNYSNSYWDIRPSDASGTLTSTAIGASQSGNTCQFARTFTNGPNDYSLYRNQYYLLVHGVWGGCTSWTWSGTLVYVPARYGSPVIIREIDLTDILIVAATAISSSEETDTTFFFSGEQANGISVWPNPVSGNDLHITVRETSLVNARFFDMTGRLINDLSLEGNSAILDISLLDPGAYLLQCTDINGTVHSRKILRN